MRLSRVLAAGLFATLALAATGCGSKSQTGVSTESGATLVRDDALAFVSIDSDLGSSQWKKVDDLSHKFPGRDKALAQLKQELAKDGVDYDKDVKPALGPEVDVAVVTGQTLEQTTAVLLTKPDDAGKLKELIKKANARDTSGQPAVYREVNGWYAIGESQAAIDRALKNGGGALSDKGTFKDAIATLPDDALAKAYVSGAQLATVVREAAQQDGSPFDPATIGLDKLDFIAASTSAEDDGIRLKGAAQGAGVKSLSSSDYASKLLGDAPGDALAFLDFRGTGTADQLEKLKSNPMFGAALQQFEAAAGVSLDDVLALLRNEVAFYLRPGAGIPEFTLVLDVKDQSAALATLDKLAARVAALSGGKVEGGAVKTINFGQFAVHYGGRDGRVVISSGVNGVSEFGGPGEKLPDSADFKEAKSAAGMPDSNGGFSYVDLKNAIPLIEGFAGLGGESIPSEVSENLRPLRSFLAWSSGSGDSRTFDAFLEIK
jgi:Protein of unknown function (DUF3352)